MKKLILLLCTISGFGIIYAQNPSFLDVKVMESLERQPASMIYYIRVNPELEEDYDLDRDYAAQRKAMRSRVKEYEVQLKQFLETNKIKYTVNREESYTIIRDEAPMVAYKVKVNNIAELDNLMILLHQLNYIEGSVGEKNYPDIEKDALALFEKLYNKARLKAEKMAILMRCKLGRILEVEDLDRKELSYYEMMQDPNMPRIYDQERAPATDQLTSITTLTMRFRFELVPQ